jgi:protein-tyrosine phosphatase
MIDVHCHILPGVDDGVQTMEEALALIAMEVKGGTKGFIATPHVIERRDFDRIDGWADRIQGLRDELSAAGVVADVVLGGEIYPSSHMVRAVQEGRPVTLGGKGKHMLVDLPMGALPNDFDSLLYELQVQGITPIIAHPERAAPFQSDPDSLWPYLERGMACQVNAASIAGKYGPRAYEVAMLFLKRRWPHFLASDAHRPSRRPILGTCVGALRSELDEDYLELLTVRSAETVLAGEALPDRPSAPPGTEARKGLLGRWFGKNRR